MLTSLVIDWLFTYTTSNLTLQWQVEDLKTDRVNQEKATCSSESGQMVPAEAPDQLDAPVDSLQTQKERRNKPPEVLMCSPCAWLDP